ncbi:cytidylyltransferase domain-containing protein [Sphingomonas canadensis]|uniref:Cytidylyltransferase domain-containing protein n=1 Tax=Sphingomonas canadensis TaxID=1219257 RepID=A0ABW3H7F1_9SPHN
MPCRAGSERVPRKNMRPFGGHENGLIELKLCQLQAMPELDKIVVSSNDEEVLDYVDRFARAHDSRFVASERPDELGRSSTSMDDFILYIAEMEREGLIFWTHVTSPFVTTEVYQAGLAAYYAKLAEGYDSLVSVTAIHKFLWDENGPVNYDNKVEKWPRSQDIRPLFEINHAMYVMPYALMREMGDRIGRRPYFHPLPEQVAMDIDWEDQFTLLDRIAHIRRAAGEL